MAIREDVRRTYTHICQYRGAQLYVSSGLNAASYDWTLREDYVQYGVTEFWRKSQSEIVRVMFAHTVTDDVRGKVLRWIRTELYPKNDLIYVWTYYNVASEYRFWIALKDAQNAIKSR